MSAPPRSKRRPWLDKGSTPADLPLATTSRRTRLVGLQDGRGQPGRRRNRRRRPIIELKLGLDLRLSKSAGAGGGEGQCALKAAEPEARRQLPALPLRRPGCITGPGIEEEKERGERT